MLKIDDPIPVGMCGRIVLRFRCFKRSYLKSQVIEAVGCVEEDILNDLDSLCSR